MLTALQSYFTGKHPASRTIHIPNAKNCSTFSPENLADTARWRAPVTSFHAVNTTRSLRCAIGHVSHAQSYFLGGKFLALIRRHLLGDSWRSVVGDGRLRAT